MSCRLSLLPCAVASVLLQELCIGDLPSFIAMIENDPDDVLEKLRSDSCSCLSNDGRCSDVNDEELRDAGCDMRAALLLRSCRLPGGLRRSSC